PKTTANVVIEAIIKNINSETLTNKVKETVVIEDVKPAVRFIGTGVIMPTSNGLLLPFEAANLKAVDIKVTKIYQDNILQFLQVNSLTGQYELSRVGKTVVNKTVPLTDVVDYNKWNRYSIDLSELITTEPGALYIVKLSIKKSYSAYPCDEVSDDEDDDLTLTTWNDINEDEDDWYYENSYYDDYYDDYGYYYYNWSERDDPCGKSYYNGKSVTRNVLASDIGIVAKAGSTKKMSVYVTDIVSAEPMPDADVEFYDYQQQLLGSVKTGSDGMAVMELKRKPYVIIAKKDKQSSYLKVQEGSSLSLSSFDVSGETVQKGIKGFIYGERGVWRPGDSLFLTFILEDKEKVLPENHPVTFDLINPSGQIVKRTTKTTAVNGFYDFRTCTEKNAPTGNWQAKMKVGNIEFTKELKIETIKPNKLKIKLNFEKDYLVTDDNSTGTLKVNWLTGAIARNLKAEVNLTLSKSATTFKKYPLYTFDNPVSGFSSENISIFSGKLDKTGTATITPDINITSSAPGVLKANFETIVYEAGGDFSTDNFSMSYHPYKTYAGLYVPENKNGDKMLYTDNAYSLGLINVDYNGNLVSNSKLKVEVYKLLWRWWWDNSETTSEASFTSSSYNKLIDSVTVSATQGTGTYSFKVEDDDWGRYLIRVTDKASGHITGKIVYADSYGSSRTSDNKLAATMLTFTADKETYKVDDKVKLTIPSSEGGRALITLESGTKVLDSYWTETEQGSTEYEFDVTAEMAPNCYAYVTLIQPHNQTLNDMPIRLYGVIPISVEDPSTHLKPKIVISDILKPEQEASVAVAEETGKAMTYTIAVVDEGLLDLTHFDTPDPWSTFYAREALGVKTWDLFDMVMGAYSGELDRILSIGGDEDAVDKGSLKANRFTPMVKFLGPFELKSGAYKIHTFKVPQYIGSVRVMVIAGDKGKYGNAEKTVTVRKPLMVLPTLPRVLSPGETVTVPVNVFAMENYVKNVSVQIIPDTMFTVTGGTTKSITFAAVGDEIVNFEMKVKDAVGVGKIKVIAVSGYEKATYDIEIDIRVPNPKVVNVLDTTLSSGISWNKLVNLIGIAGTNKGVIEMSSVPPLNLEKRLDYLIEYPHGCIEQTTSGAFPQLYLSDLLELTAKEKTSIEKNMKAAIKSLNNFQLSSGGLGYWSSSEKADEWGTSYAGHFMLEAEQKGYVLPVGFLTSWKKYQKAKAISWSYNSYLFNDDLNQAYRLYTLALAKAPELGAMNKLYETKTISVPASWRLAAAYQLAGKPELALKIIATTGTIMKEYKESWNTYGTEIRDKAMIIEALCLMKLKSKAITLVKDVSAKLCSDDWLSTQTTAYSLIALSKYTGASASSGVSFSYSINNATAVSSTSKKYIVKIDIGIKNSDTQEKVLIKNTGTNILYARIITQGIPSTADKTSAQNKLKLSVAYKDINGKKIDISEIEQGTNFIAEVTVTNPGSNGTYKQLALVHMFPSGWEIFNSRMSEYAETATTASVYTYQDIRDDRVYTYFDLLPNKSKTFKIMLNASYLGKFYQPAVYCEAMYDNTINARVPGSWIEVVEMAE
ncbi:MAG: MG2 domain-containing protein, partial [Bacteroidota bacterium]